MEVIYGLLIVMGVVWFCVVTLVVVVYVFHDSGEWSKSHYLLNETDMNQ